MPLYKGVGSDIPGSYYGLQDYPPFKQSILRLGILG